MLAQQAMAALIRLHLMDAHLWPWTSVQVSLYLKDSILQKQNQQKHNHQIP